MSFLLWSTVRAIVSRCESLTHDNLSCVNAVTIETVVGPLLSRIHFNQTFVRVTKRFNATTIVSTVLFLTNNKEVTRRADE